MNEDIVSELRKISMRAPHDSEHRLVGQAADAIERLSICAEQKATAERELSAVRVENDRLRENERQITKARDWYLRALEELSSNGSYVAQTALRLARESF